MNLNLYSCVIPTPLNPNIAVFLLNTPLQPSSILLLHHKNHLTLILEPGNMLSHVAAFLPAPPPPPTVISIPINSPPKTPFHPPTPPPPLQKSTCYRDNA